MPQNPPYVPTRDADLGDWANNFNTLLTANPALYGLVAGDAVAVAAVVTPFLAALALSTNPATRTPVTVAAKDAAKAAMFAVVLPYATAIAGNGSVTNGNKTAIGVTVRITTKTRNAVTANNSELTITYNEAGAPILKNTDPITPTTTRRPLGATMWEFQIERSTTGAPPWTLYANDFSSRPYRSVDPEFYEPETYSYRIRSRWIGALLPGGGTNAGPWSAWQALTF